MTPTGNDTIRRALHERPARERAELRVAPRDGDYVAVDVRVIGERLNAQASPSAAYTAALAAVREERRPAIRCLALGCVSAAAQLPDGAWIEVMRPADELLVSVDTSRASVSLSVPAGATDLPALDERPARVGSSRQVALA